ncbi:ABC transporter permease [Xylophilus sp.]|uniref:ABC transporter permease n=1 Tax=Xylophilus sp. TaxID=2653893 RepID=UPI0013B95526|nr:ABC transporter permease [Xylophilus sp.]KAF1050126.1 MAG: Oligopeptide transport system permease protein OppC [Xylophilus sp.]
MSTPLYGDDAAARPASWRSQLAGALLGGVLRKHTRASTSPHCPTGRRSWRDQWPVLAALLRNPAAIVGLVLLALIVFAGLSADWFFPGDPLDIVAQPLLRPGEDRAFFLGTDFLGRDIAAGLAHGARVSLLVGITAAVVGVTVGTLIGAVAGYFGGRVDAVLNWLIEIFQTTPSFLLVVVIVSITQSSLEVIAVVIGLTTWETVARLIRAQFRALLGSDFVLAARSIGFGHRWIIFKEILPNALPPIVVTASVMVAGAILMESSLAFLGVGDPNKVSWGSMIGGGRDMLRTAWYLTAIPGLALVVTVFSLNLVGDALIEAMNPRLRGRVTV